MPPCSLWRMLVNAALAFMHIRFAKSEDAEAIAALHASSWGSAYGTVLSPEYLRHTVPDERKAVWRGRFASPKDNQIVLVAEEVDEITGFACVFVGEHEEWGSYLDNLHVSQHHQGKGVGKELLLRVAYFCNQERPGQGLYLSVNQANHRAQAFYLSLGASNTQTSIWNAPDGSEVPTFRFAWQSIGMLVEKAANKPFDADGSAAGQLNRWAS